MIHAADGVNGALRLKFCWALAIAWLVASSAIAAWPSLAAATPGLPVPGLLFMLFTLLHGSLSYGWKGIGLYFLIGILVGFGMEVASIATGFPFGYYTHNVPGTKLLGVPIPTILAYAVIGAPAWSVARLIVRDNPCVSRGADQWTTPIIATFIMTGVDLAYDPIGATVLGQWIYRHPSGQFGVPLSNFLGWLLTGWVIFQLFAFTERHFRPSRAVAGGGYWLSACVVWLGNMVQYPFLFLNAPEGTARVGNRMFVIADVYEAGLIVALLTIVFSALLGILRLISHPPRSWPTS